LQGFLRDSTPVAIKSLSAESKQGTKEFLTEINVISDTRHPNLVELIGCCVEDNHRILVYEYMENNSLASALLGNYQIIRDLCGTGSYFSWDEFKSFEI
jgi:serine/threonine protein kinase